MTRRLVLGYLAVTLLVLLLLEVPLAVSYAQRSRERLISAAERDAAVIASIYEDTLERGLTLDPRPADQYTQRTGARVVVVDAVGTSRIDTEQSVPRDFSTRPEIAEALAGRRSTGTRHSATLGTDLLFVALPIASSGVVHGALRVSLDTSHVDASVHRFWAGLVGIAAVVLAAVAILGSLVARSVTRPIRVLDAAAARFAAGELRGGVEPVIGPPELRTLGDTMATMAERLAGQIDEQRAFVADASHQLRTPLTALRLRLENLEQRLADERPPVLDQRDAAELEAAIDETERLGRLVTDLLRLARADQPATPVAVDLVSLVADRVDTWTAIADAQDVRLVLDAPTAARVRAVPGAIEQIVDNLLDNALTVAPPASVVAVHVGVEADRTSLSVSDQGPGLSDDDKARALRRFWRGSTASPGTGLGLPIASALATASGGHLALADAAPHGLCVTVHLLADR